MAITWHRPSPRKLGGEATVSIVTRFPVVSPWADERMEGKLTRARLRELGIGWHVSSELDVVAREGPVGRDDQGKELAFPGAATVLVTQRLSCDELFPLDICRAPALLERRHRARTKRANRCRALEGAPA